MCEDPARAFLSLELVGLAVRRVLDHAVGTEPGQRWREGGNSYYGIQKAFKKAGLYRKWKLTHEIRRAVASTMLLNGTPIHVVKEMLGRKERADLTLLAAVLDSAKGFASAPSSSVTNSLGEVEGQARDQPLARQLGFNP